MDNSADSTCSELESQAPDLDQAWVAPWLTVVLPAHNEVENIGAVAVSFLTAAKALGRPCEVVVVDDGSTDGTVEALRAHPGGNHPALRVVKHGRNAGYGGALRTGFREARGRWVFFTDSDGQFEASSLAPFLEGLDEQGVDLIVGYRYSRHDRWHRRALGRVWTGTVRTLLGVRARDVNCAFKVMRRTDLERMKLEADGALINAELLHKARRMGLNLAQRPVPHLSRKHGEASGARPDVVGRALWELARYRLRSVRSRFQDAGPVQG
jgi:glycosyltransferase involved in cell wall biosynthesis